MLQVSRRYSGQQTWVSHQLHSLKQDWQFSVTNVLLIWMYQLNVSTKSLRADAIASRVLILKMWG